MKVRPYRLRHKEDREELKEAWLTDEHGDELRVVGMSREQVLIGGVWHTPAYLLKHYKHADGTPAGVVYG